MAKMETTAAIHTMTKRIILVCTHIHKETKRKERESREEETTEFALGNP